MKRSLGNNGFGMEQIFHSDGDGFAIESRQDVSGILDLNKALQSVGDGFTPSRDMARIATIPTIVAHKWLKEEGWWAFSPDPDCQRKLKQKLNDHEWRHLRTSELTF